MISKPKKLVIAGGHNHACCPEPSSGGGLSGGPNPTTPVYQSPDIGGPARFHERNFSGPSGTQTNSSYHSASGSLPPAEIPELVMNNGGNDLSVRYMQAPQFERWDLLQEMQPFHYVHPIPQIQIEPRPNDTQTQNNWNDSNQMHNRNPYDARGYAGDQHIATQAPAQPKPDLKTSKSMFTGYHSEKYASHH